jgi:hypothetical protein
MVITERERGRKKEKIVCKADWDNFEMIKIFCNIVVEEINAENRPLGTLNARGYKNMGEKFLARTGKKLYPKAAEESLG